MKKIILLVSLSFILIIGSSCIKKEQRQNGESQIVELLNQNKTDSALEKINQELDMHKTDELLYLKASVLSMKAGVDIYTLFPLLKAKIFDVAISQWSQNREFQKKSDAQKMGMDIGPQDIKDQKKEYVPLVGSDLDYKIDGLDIMSAFILERGYCEISMFIQPVKKTSGSDIWFTTQLKSENTCNEILAKVKNAETFEISPSLDSTIRNVVSYKHSDEWNRHKVNIGNKETYVKIMGGVWTLVDMIPILSKIPKVSNNGFKNLEEAQEILSKIKENHPEKNDELGAKSRKQLIMLSALKIIAHVQNAFNLSIVKTPMELLCSSNEQAAEELIESEKDALYLINAIEDPEIIKKNKELFENIKTKFSLIIQEENDHPEIKENRIAKLKSALEETKKENCER